MIPEIGHFSLVLATTLAAALALVALAGQRCRASHLKDYLQGASAPLGGLMGLAMVLALGSLIWAFLGNDFSVAYVAHNANSSLAWYYKIAAVWGGHEGSLLFWTAALVLITTFVALAPLPDEDFKQQVVGLLAALALGFGLVLLLSSNPYLRLLPDVPIEGRDLNPVLQNWALIIHPPLVFFGYVGLTVLFAGALAALLRGGYTPVILAWLRRWTLFTWLMLTGGNALGSWWAYHELGWGGWWFWDPVENSSFMPWLIATALLHTLVLNRQQRSLNLTTLFLCLTGFALSLIGTFMVRSGVIQSVHAFASDSARGIAILSLLFASLVPATALFALKAPKLASEEVANLKSVGGLLLVGVVLIIVATFAVLLGTTYPLLFAVLDLGSISVGAPYFNAIFVPISCLCAALAAMALMPRQLPQGRRRALTAGQGVLSLALATVIALQHADGFNLWLWQGVLACSWLFMAVVTALLCPGVPVTRPRLGVMLAHLGIAVAILGATVVSNYEEDASVRMGPGKGRQVANYILVYEETEQVRNDSFRAAQANIRVMDVNEKTLGYLHPQRRTFMDDMTELTVSDLYRTAFGDLYVSLGPPLEGGDFLVRISHKPMVNAIWAGAVLMVLGGLMVRRRPKGGLL